MWAVFFRDLSAVYNGHQLNGSAPQFVSVEVLETSAEPSIADVGYWADMLRPSPEPPPTVDPNIRRLQDDLSEKLGAAVAIEHAQSGRGRLVVKYNSLDELDGILTHIV